MMRDDVRLCDGKEKMSGYERRGLEWLRGGRCNGWTFRKLVLRGFGQRIQFREDVGLRLLKGYLISGRMLGRGGRGGAVQASA